MWIIISVLLGLTVLYLFISNSIKNDRIAMLQYTIIQLTNEDMDIVKAFKEYKRFKG